MLEEKALRLFGDGRPRTVYDLERELGITSREASKVLDRLLSLIHI